MDVKRQMKNMGICIIIPTYNNATTIRQIIDDCLEWTDDIVAVNDGSTDATNEILSTYAQTIHVVRYTHNKGKGYALKKGFEYAKEHNYTYALTIDADGQHSASDIPQFVKTAMRYPHALIMGSRNIQTDNMPRKNTFANKFSNFWFTVQTLQRIPDTQTGYRLYPLKPMTHLWWVTAKYEAELEMLVFAAWHGIKIIPIPIQVYYPPAEKRVSHFRPGMDFFRISVTNTILCLLAIVYGGPRMLINKLFSKQQKT